MFSHQQSLMVTLKEEKEPAMALHLVTVLLFQRYTSCIIHAPGRFVPNIISFLGKHMSDDEYAKLTDYQRLVMLHLKLTSGAKRDDPDDDPPQSHQGEGAPEEGLDVTPPASSDDPHGSSAHVMDELNRQLDALKELATKPKKENE